MDGWTADRDLFSERREKPAIQPSIPWILSLAQEGFACFPLVASILACVHCWDAWTQLCWFINWPSMSLRPSKWLWGSVFQWLKGRADLSVRKGRCWSRRYVIISWDTFKIRNEKEDSSRSNADSHSKKAGTQMNISGIILSLWETLMRHGPRPWSDQWTNICLCVTAISVIESSLLLW